MRIRSRWQLKKKERSLEEISSAMGFIVWRIAGNTVLNLENSGFQTDSNAQRLQVIQEMVAFIVHAVDRACYHRLTHGDRQKFISALAVYLAGHYQENMCAAAGADEYRKAFLSNLNARMSDYAEFGMIDLSPDFAMRRLLGVNVTAQLGSKDRKWVVEHIMQIEVPEALETLQSALKNLLPDVT